MSTENKAEFQYLKEKSERDLVSVNSDLNNYNNTPKMEANLLEKAEMLRARIDVTGEQSKALIGEPRQELQSRDLSAAIDERVQERRLGSERT
jgi:hypothetical protein